MENIAPIQIAEPKREKIEWYSVAGIYGVSSLHIRGGRYNSNFNSAVSAVYDFQPGNVHSE